MPETLLQAEDTIKAIKDNPDLLKKINSSEFIEYSKNKESNEIKSKTVQLLKDFREKHPMTSLTDGVKRYYREVIKFSKQNISELQKALNKKGANIKADSQFGNETFLAIVNFQLKNGLLADGKAGNNTLKKLGLGTVETFYKHKEVEKSNTKNKVKKEMKHTSKERDEKKNSSENFNFSEKNVINESIKDGIKTYKNKIGYSILNKAKVIEAIKKSNGEEIIIGKYAHKNKNSRYGKSFNEKIIIETDGKKAFIELNGTGLINDNRKEIKSDGSNYTQKLKELMDEYISENSNIADINKPNNNERGSLLAKKINQKNETEISTFLNSNFQELTEKNKTLLINNISTEKLPKNVKTYKDLLKYINKVAGTNINTYIENKVK